MEKRLQVYWARVATDLLCSEEEAAGSRRSRELEGTLKEKSAESEEERERAACPEAGRGQGASGSVSWAEAEKGSSLGAAVEERAQAEVGWEAEKEGWLAEEKEGWKAEARREEGREEGRWSWPAAEAGRPELALTYSCFRDVYDDDFDDNPERIEIRNRE